MNHQLSPPEAARFLGVTTREVIDLIEAGERRRGRQRTNRGTERMVIDQSQLDAYRARQAS